MKNTGFAFWVVFAAQVLGTTQSSMSGFTDATSHASTGGRSACFSGFVEVEAHTTKNLVLDYDVPVDQSVVTQSIVSQWTPDSDYPASITKGTKSVSGTYKIGATLCMPSNNKTTKVQLLTHGIGFDRRYWDIATNYSYVDVATGAGYATFAYDRLGTGMSAKEDPINTIQSPLELAILNGLAEKLRQGYFADRAFSTIIGVGHSFGSALTQGLTAATPQALDAAVLTGFSRNASGMPTFNVAQIPTIASLVNPYRFGNLSNGYLAIGTPIALQTTFFHAPGFDPSILALAYDIGSTVTSGEYFTTGLIVATAENFTGPVAVVNGNEDLGFCFGNCSYPSNILAEVAPDLYPKVPKNRTTTYRAPSSGHGLNFHYGAAAAFDYIQAFLSQQGL